eukprot:sb/3474479/
MYRSYCLNLKSMDKIMNRRLGPRFSGHPDLTDKTLSPDRGAVKSGSNCTIYATQVASPPCGKDVMQCIVKELGGVWRQPIRTRYLGHMTGYQPIRDQYFVIRSVDPGRQSSLAKRSNCRTCQAVNCWRSGNLVARLP